MAMPEFVEHQPDALTETTDGIQTARNFSILASSPLDAKASLFTNAGVQIGVAYSSPYGETPDASVRCSQIVIEPRPGACTGTGQEGLYMAKAVYSRRTSQAQPGGSPVWRIRGSLVSQVVDADRWGLAIRTSSDEPVELQKMVPTELLYGEWWVTSSNLITLQSTLRPYRGAINSQPFFGAAAGNLLCHGVDVAEVIDNQVKLTANFEYRATLTSSEINAVMRRRNSSDALVSETTYPGWVGRYADMGRREFHGYDDDDNPIYKAIEQAEDGSGRMQQVMEPVPLDGAGKRAKDGDPPAMIAVELYERVLDFGTIPGL